MKKWNKLRFENRIAFTVTIIFLLIASIYYLFMLKNVIGSIDALFFMALSSMFLVFLGLLIIIIIWLIGLLIGYIIKKIIEN